MKGGGGGGRGGCGGTCVASRPSHCVLMDQVRMSELHKD